MPRARPGWAVTGRDVRPVWSGERRGSVGRVNSLARNADRGTLTLSITRSMPALPGARTERRVAAASMGGEDTVSGIEREKERERSGFLRGQEKESGAEQEPREKRNALTSASAGARPLSKHARGLADEPRPRNRAHAREPRKLSALPWRRTSAAGARRARVRQSTKGDGNSAATLPSPPSLFFSNPHNLLPPP